MKIDILGAHNYESRDFRLSGVVIDDTLALDAGGLTSSLSVEAQLKLKAVFLTHQHYDHLRDLPALAMNFFLHNASIRAFSTAPVREAVAAHLLNESLYPRFMEEPADRPVVQFNLVEPYQMVDIDGYNVLPAPVKHAKPAVGYQVASSDGKKVFYTGDTGPGLADCWRHISPELLIIEVTASDRYKEWGAKAGHLTPELLGQELTEFQKVRGYLPRVVTVHMNPGLQQEIEEGLSRVARSLDASITPGREGMQLFL